MTPRTAVTVRLPDDLLARLRQLAAAERRSLTAQLAILLERGLDQSDPPHLANSPAMTQK